MDPNNMPTGERIDNVPSEALCISLCDNWTKNHPDAPANMNGEPSPNTPK